MAQLSGEHDDLTTMMTFVCDEICQDMADVEGKIAPGVRSGSGDRAAVVKTELQQTNDAAATAIECCDQLLRLDLVAIDDWRRRDVVLLSERPDPHAARIVKVAGDHPHRSTWRAGHFRVP